MKKVLSKMTALMVVILLCTGLTGCVRYAGYLRERGNGDVVTKEISLSETLKGARTLTSIDILLDPELTDKAVLEGESNILDLTDVDISGGVLSVNFKPQYTIDCTRPVTLRVPLISGGLLETTSSGSISMLGNGTLKGDSFELSTSSSGSVTAAIETDKLRAVSTSSGSINVSGSATAAVISLSSSGSFNGSDCQTQTVDAHLSSSGDANVCVSGELSGSLSSSGSIYYSGNPGKVNVSSSSSGQARAR